MECDIPQNAREMEPMLDQERMVHKEYVGFSWFRPKCIQWMANFIPFMILLCGNGIFQGAIVNGFVSTSITSIERRYKLTSTQSGLFAATYDIFVTVMLIPLAVSGNKFNKVFVIGVGMVLVAIGAMMVAIPEFMAGKYNVGELRKDVCGVNSTCTEAETQAVAFFGNPQYLLLLLSQALIGIGASPMFTYGFTCIDDYDGHERTGKNIAFYLTSSSVGPALAFFASGLTLSYWGDFRSTPSEMGIEGTQDPRWIGMYWIGFVVSGFLALFFAIPMLMLPKVLKDTKKRKANDVHRTDKKMDKDFEGQSWKLLRTFWFFLTNPTCLSVVLMQTVESMLMNGYITFVPKLLETLFGFSSSFSSTMTGLLVVPTAIIANFIGGVLARRVQHNFRKAMDYVIICCICAGVLGACLLIRCDGINIAGVNVPKESFASFGVNSSCNANCNCDAFFNPVCDKNSQLTFLSPCHAGVTDSPDFRLGGPEYTHSTCSISNVVEKGYCETSCPLAITFFFIFFVFLAFFIFTPGPILQNAIVRVVKESHRDEYMCFGWLWMRIAGSIPGAILFGYIIDWNCIYKQTDCNSEKCQYYDAKNLGFAFWVMTVICKLAAIVCLLVAKYSYTVSVDEEEVDSEKSPRTVSTFSTESVQMKLEKEVLDTNGPATVY